VRDLGVHTEMLTDGIVDLYRAGVVTGARKALYPGKVVCTFGVGTTMQYETADRNPDFLCHAVDLITLPQIVTQNDRVVAINNTTQMDLLSSTHERHGARASRVVVDLTPGNVVTATRADMMHVVTEYGIVNLKGKSVPERARAMISIAHPDFRDELECQAREHGLIPNSVF
jgi:acyl-CoA hydrolase